MIPLNIILAIFIKISQEIFEINRIKTHRHTHTDRHIHADENNTCPKTKFLGQVNEEHIGNPHRFAQLKGYLNDFKRRSM